MKGSRRIIFFLSAAAAYIGIGYLRDFIFVNINFAIKKLQAGDEATFEGHSILEFLKTYDANTLYYSKYVLTGLFTVLNFIPGALLLYFLFPFKTYLRWFGALYGAVILISILFYGGGQLFGSPHHGYSLARLFMGFLQSPVPAMVFLPLCWLHQREHQDRTIR